MSPELTRRKMLAAGALGITGAISAQELKSLLGDGKTGDGNTPEAEDGPVDIYTKVENDRGYGEITFEYEKPMAYLEVNQVNGDAYRKVDAVNMFETADQTTTSILTSRPAGTWDATAKAKDGKTYLDTVSFE